MCVVVVKPVLAEQRRPQLVSQRQLHCLISCHSTGEGSVDNALNPSLYFVSSVGVS